METVLHIFPANCWKGRLQLWIYSMLVGLCRTVEETNHHLSLNVSYLNDILVYPSGSFVRYLHPYVAQLSIIGNTETECLLSIGTDQH